MLYILPIPFIQVSKDEIPMLSTLWWYLPCYSIPSFQKGAFWSAHHPHYPKVISWLHCWFQDLWCSSNIYCFKHPFKVLNISFLLKLSFNFNLSPYFVSIFAYRSYIFRCLITLSYSSNGCNWLAVIFSGLFLHFFALTFNSPLGNILYLLHLWFLHLLPLSFSLFLNLQLLF